MILIMLSQCKAVIFIIYLKNNFISPRTEWWFQGLVHGTKQYEE
jgi:hypothetical protein